MFTSLTPEYASRSFQRIEVRIGDEDPGSTHTTIVSKNKICSTFLNKGENMKYYDFTCPSSGIKGKYVTITSNSNGAHATYDIFSAAEVELFGKNTVRDCSNNNHTILLYYLK